MVRYLIILALLFPNLLSAQGRPPFNLDTLQYRTFRYFWDLPDRQWQIPDRWPSVAFSSIAATGFGLSAILVGTENKWISRDEAAARVLKTLEVLKNLPQGPQESGIAGYKGFFYHFLDHQQALRFKQVELSSIDSGLLLAGVLSCLTYFDGNYPVERQIRETADFIFRRVEWSWMLNSNNRLSMGWKPETGFIQAEWFGYTEAMLLYIMAIGSPTHPIPPASWDAWCQNYTWDAFKGSPHVQFGPLFGHQYSHVWIDFKGIQDAYMRKKNLDYAENTRRATYVNRNYCIENPRQYRGYGENIWGLSACDGPMDYLNKEDTGALCQSDRRKGYMGYSARGVASDYLLDDGTLTPTAAGGSLPYAPEICLPALASMWDTYYDSLVGVYGFRDAFNPGFTACGSLPGGWFDPDYLGIDQGPIVLMIQNFKNGFLWNLMRKNPYFQRGLQLAGFQGGWIDGLPPAGPSTADGFNPAVPTHPTYYFDRGVFRKDAASALPYRLLKPGNILATNAFASKKAKNGLPLLVFLHGSGERGNNNEIQLKNGVMAFCEPEQWRKNPCFILVPQCPEGQSWTADRGRPFHPKATPPMHLLMELIDSTLAQHPEIDRRRIYLTGLSMGGFGTFDLLARRPELFAAAIPVCGGGDEETVSRFAHIPLWAFHGSRDEVVYPERSRSMTAAIKRAGGSPHYREYHTLGHAIWQETYYSKETMRWLFKQRKP
jgi:predicted esterase